MGLKIFSLYENKVRTVSAGSMIPGWEFATPEEKARVRNNARFRRELARDSGRADQKLRKFSWDE